MGTSSPVVGNLDRHMELLRGSLLAVGLELNRPLGLVGPDLGTEARGTAQGLAHCSALFRQQ